MRRLISTFVTLLLAFGWVTLPATPAQAVDLIAGPLSPTGNLAVQDLRECLNSNPGGALDIYYLIDASGSLFKRGTSPGTDPDIKRAEILKNSLVQLARLSDTYSVQYSAGFFGSTFVQPSGWHEVTPSETGSALEAEIIGQASLGWTNWDRAISGAKNALSEQKTVSGGCQILIWLTDGGINLEDDVQATASAINSLCGRVVRSDGEGPQLGLGPFNELRQANVTVFGTLLSVTNSLDETDRENIPFMQPMVEGTSPSSEVTCGEVPVPQGYSNGAYIQATDTTQLSRVFLGLNESIAGGARGDIDANGSFQIDPGVAGFSVIFSASGEWTLRPPLNSNEPTIASSDLSDANVQVTSSAGALMVTWPVQGKAPAPGEWKFTSGDTGPELLRFSGLNISLESLPEIVAQRPVTITGSITRESSEPIALHNYDYTLTIFKRVAGTAELTKIATVSADPNSGEFSYEYTDHGPEGDYDILASVSNLTTKASRLTLSDLSTSQPAAIKVPDQFPTIGSQPEMTPLVGVSGESTGFFTIVGPAKDGANGSVCFNMELAPIDSPNVNRDESWDTSLTIAGETLQIPRCIDVAHGETKTVSVSIANSKPANSTVRATLSIAMMPEQGAALDQNVDFRLDSTQPINQAVFYLAILLLFALGLLVPLALLYGVNYFSAKIGYGARLQRASFPVSVLPDGTIVSRSGMNLRGTEVGTDDFKFQAPKEDSRKFADPDLGLLAATPSRNPFGDVMYSIVPAAGRLVFTLGKTGRQSSRLAFRTARRTTFDGHMNTLAALTVSAADHLGKGARESINGTLVVYSTSPGAGRTGYSTRMAEVLSAHKLRARLSSVREALRAEQESQRTKSNGEVDLPKSTPSPVSSRTDSPPATSRNGRETMMPPPPPAKNRSGVTSEPPPRKRGGTVGDAGRNGQASRLPHRDDQTPPPPRHK